MDGRKQRVLSRVIGPKMALDRLDKLQTGGPGGSVTGEMRRARIREFLLEMREI